MLSIGSVLLYGENGVCRVESVLTKQIHGRQSQYYVLRPVYSSASTIYVPVQNPALLKKCRALLSKEELLSLRRTDKTSSLFWIENDTQRAQCFDEIFAACDREKLLSLLKLLSERKQALSLLGRHLHTADENAMHRAERLLGEEIAYVFGLPFESALSSFLKPGEMN